MKSFTAEELHRALKYDPETGIFTRLYSYGKFKAGEAAGSRNKKGYIVVGIFGRIFYAHRLAWFWMTREWSLAQIDHHDRNKANNSWTNLRQATDAQNRANCDLYSNNKSGYAGIYFRKDTGAWSVKCARRSIGSFASLEAAIIAREKASLAMFGEFSPLAEIGGPVGPVVLREG